MLEIISDVYNGRQHKYHSDVIAYSTELTLDDICAAWL